MLIKLPFSLSITGLTSLLIYVQVAGLPVPHPPTLLPVHMCFLIWDRWSVGPTSFWSNALAQRTNMWLLSVTLAVFQLHRLVERTR
jgi:hypothetical protein